MSLRRTLDAMALSVGRAKSVPLSASCWVNRAEMLSLIERARAELPAELDEATQILLAHQEVLDNAEHEGEQVLEQARAKAAAMVEDTVIVASAQARADAILHAARTEATRLLRSADEYCDKRLGLFQADLEKTLDQVQNGRSRLQERSELDTFAQETGLADAADAVDNANYEAQQQARRATANEVHDQEADQSFDQDVDQRADRDTGRTPEAGAEAGVGAGGAGVETEAADLSDGYDLTDGVAAEVPEQARPGDRVIDLREDAQPAGSGAGSGVTSGSGLGAGRTLQ